MSRYVKGFFSMPFPKIGIFGIAQHPAGQARAIIGRERQAVFPFNEVGRCEMVGRDEGAANAEDLLHPAQFPGHHAHVRCVIAGAEISFGHPLQKDHNALNAQISRQALELRFVFGGSRTRDRQSCGRTAAVDLRKGPEEEFESLARRQPAGGDEHAGIVGNCQFTSPFLAFHRIRVKSAGVDAQWKQVNALRPRRVHFLHEPFRKGIGREDLAPRRSRCLQTCFPTPNRMMLPGPVGRLPLSE